MKKGKIIFLTGVSSAGKTTLSRTLQNKLSEPYYWLSKDTIIDDMAPEKFKEINWQDIYRQCCTLLFNTIKMFSDMSINIIADSVMFNVQKDWIDLLYNYPVILVHVTCNSIDELRRREKERGDRDIGQGESQLTKINPQIIYDVTVDTFEKSTEECADIIISLLSDTKNYKAFKKMHAQII